MCIYTYVYIIIKFTDFNILKNLTDNWIQYMQIIIQLIMQSIQKLVVIPYLIINIRLPTQNKIN